MNGAGELDVIVTIERYTATTGSLNEQVKVWSEFAEVHAKCRYVSDGEQLAANQQSAHARARLKVRHSSDTASVNAKDRLQFDGRIWNIVGNIPLDQGRNRWRQITAVCEAD